MLKVPWRTHFAAFDVSILTFITWELQLQKQLEFKDRWYE